MAVFDLFGERSRMGFWLRAGQRGDCSSRNSDISQIIKYILTALNYNIFYIIISNLWYAADKV